MKRHIQSFLVISTVLFLLVSLLIGCNGNSSPTTPTSDIIGSWQNTASDRAGGYTTTLTYKADGKFSFSCTKKNAGSGTYTLQDSNIELKITESNDPNLPVGTVLKGTYSLSGNILTLIPTSIERLSDTDTWTRIS